MCPPTDHEGLLFDTFRLATAVRSATFGRGVLFNRCVLHIIEEQVAAINVDVIVMMKEVIITDIIFKLDTLQCNIHPTGS